MIGRNISRLPHAVVSSHREELDTEGYQPILDTMRAVFQHEPSVEIDEQAGTATLTDPEDARLAHLAIALERNGSLTHRAGGQYTIEWHRDDYREPPDPDTVARLLGRGIA